MVEPRGGAVLDADQAPRRAVACAPGGSQGRMRRLMSLIQSRRIDVSATVPHGWKPDAIEAACECFAQQRDGVL